MLWIYMTLKISKAFLLKSNYSSNEDDFLQLNLAQYF